MKERRNVGTRRVRVCSSCKVLSDRLFNNKICVSCEVKRRLGLTGGGNNEK